MNILFLTSRPPFPPNRGDKVRTNFILKIFSQNHKIYLFSFIEGKKEKRYEEFLKPYCEKIYLIKLNRLISFIKLFRGFINRLPFQVNYYYSKKSFKKIEEIVKKNNIDCVYTHLIRMAPYSKKMKCYKILDYTDAISMEYKRSLPFRKNPIKKFCFNIEASRTHKYEKKIVDYFDESWFISKEDIDFLDFTKIMKVKIITNPVKISKKKSDYIKKNVITFVGNLSVPHNIYAVEFIFHKIMPKLIAKDNNIQFHVVGADPVKIIQDMNGKRNTKVFGFVEDLYRKLINSDIFVAPMFFSAGVQNKVLEAMAVGLPVITSKNVINSLNLVDGEEIICAEDEYSYIASINELMSDSELREKIGKSGREFIKKNYYVELIEKNINSSLRNINLKNI